MDTITTILKYGHDKNCMLLLVESFQNSSRRTTRTSRDDGIVVYAADLGSGSKAYFSVQGKAVQLSSGDTVQLNGWYANKLGLKDGEPLPLRRIKTTVPSAVRIQMEPVSTDDWEILEKNAGRVEEVLLNQVRVVWKGQIMPVWIQKSICVYFTISGVEPAASCVILENNTEVVVAPKIRASVPPSTLNLPSQHTTSSSDQELRKQQYSQLSKQSQQYQSMNSPSRHRTEQLTSSSEYDNIDILEPRPSMPSPSKSPRLSVKRNSAPRPSSFSNRSSTLLHRPMVQRQSSLMESVMRYIFPTIFMGEKKELPDNLSDSDRGSFIDFSMQNLPSRNGVLRIQAMNLSYALEDYFSISKAELNKQITSRSLFSFRNSAHKTLFKDSLEDQKNMSIPLEIFHPSTVYVDAECTKNERLIHPYLPHLPNNFIARLQRLPSPQEKAEAAQKAGKKVRASSAGIVAEPSQADNVENLDGMSSSAETGDLASISGSCYVRVVAIDRKAGLTDSVWQKAADQVLSNQPLLYGHVIIPDALRRQLRLGSTGSVWIQTGTVDLVIPRKVHIYVLSSLPKTVGSDLVIMAFTNFIRQCANEEHPMVVFQGIFLKFVIFPDVHAEVQLTFFGENDPGNVKAVTMLSEVNIDLVQIVVERDMWEDKLGVINTRLPYCHTSDFDAMPFSQKLKQLGGVDDLVQKALLYLHASLASRPLSRHCFQVRGGLSHGILLITGPKGSGKTSLVKGLCRKMAHLPVLAHVALIDCNTLRGKTVSTIQKILEVVFDEAAWREPAVIVLENLDAIVPAASGPDTELTGESLYSAKNAQVLEGLIRYEIENNSRVTMIATSTSRSSLHPSLVSSRGMHCIQQTLNIGSPDKDAREKILLSILQKHSSISLETVKTLDVTSIAMKTESYVARDLELLVNRTLHAKMSKDKEADITKFTLTSEDFEETLSTFKPVSVRNVPLHKAGDLGWVDVGGLSEVKRVLIETLRWPTKYPQLFSSCPLRLRSGILMYGAPGTGKTLLAGVVAKECGLNFISVKGPELLNKYIGASEQAVRDLFTKAQSAKPCILFFDEFDSIAPKRGHDSTGVTDRVVNQFLTQLDGVEGLQGVYVLAATSRPDLIDPALLRPGRLDICLNCPMPDENDRCDILIALTHKMSLAADVDLREVAAVCEYFTGADLKAMLYNAQLKVIHEQTDGDRSLNESVVWIKGDSSQCATMRRASVVMDAAGAIKLSLSKSISGSSFGEKSTPGDLQSPRQISRSSEQQSPIQRINSADNRTPKSPHIQHEDEIGETDEIRKAKFENIFHYPDHVELGSGDEANRDTRTLSNDVEPDGGNSENEINDQVDGIPMKMNDQVYGIIMKINDQVDGIPMRDSRSSESLPSSHSKTVPDAVLADLSENPYKQHFQNVLPSKDSNDSENPNLDKVLSNHLNRDQTYVAAEDVQTKWTFTDVPVTNVEHIVSASDSDIPYQDKVDDILENLNTTKNAVSETDDFPHHQKSVSTSHTTNYRKMRGAERARGRGIHSNLTISKTDTRQGSEVKSPSMERPVTVFTSLESGLATLSAEDEARYLAMIKLIQHRDEILFEAANAKHRTSLYLESKPSVLMEVCQRHLLEAAKSMRPSVSVSERKRYMKIYDSFVSSRKGAFEKPQEATVGKRATLA